MTELSRDQMDEIVARVTAEVRAEVLGHEGLATLGELRIPMRAVAGLSEDALWAPWTVALPADVLPSQIMQGPGPKG